MKKFTAIGVALAMMVWTLPALAGNNYPGGDPGSKDSTTSYEDQYKDAWQGQNAFQNLLANADFAGVKNVADIDLKQVNILKEAKVSIGNASAKGMGGFGEIDSAMSAAAGYDRDHSSMTGSTAAATDAASGFGPASASASTAIAVGDIMTSNSITGIYGVALSGASVNVNQAALNTVTAVANTTFNQGR